MRTTTRRIAALAMAVALLGAACSDDETTTASDGDGGTTSTTATTAGDEMADDGVAAPMAGPLEVVSTEFGEALATADGMVLYAFESDTAGTGTCVDDCATKWPPVAADDAVTYEGAELGSIERTDGTTQLTVAGKPVYTFSGDLPGEASCQGGDGVWWILGPDGAYNKVVTPATG